MKKVILSIFALVISFSSGFATVVTITNSGLTYSPATVTINQGDTVIFSISASHNAVEVAEATWNSGGSTALSGGFSLPFGGGIVTDLSAGDHFYVCQPHASAGMKGKITVQPNSVSEAKKLNDICLFPNPALNFIQIRNSEDKATPFFITDQIGREIMKGNISRIQNGIDIRSLNRGSYFLILPKSEKKCLPFIKE